MQFSPEEKTRKLKRKIKLSQLPFTNNNIISINRQLSATLNLKMQSTKNTKCNTELEDAEYKKRMP